mgnify:CR=1 FL=1
MDNYTVEEYTIDRTTLQRVKDKDGEYWYPLTSFYEKLLLRKNKTARIRDVELYEKHLKVFSILPKENSTLPLKTWCIDTEGMYILLYNMEPINDTFERTKVRERRLAAARKFFNVRDHDELGDFITFTPASFNNYDIWSILCLENDKKITKNTLWKRCYGCNYYYPTLPKYYKMNPNTKVLSDKCEMCKGNPFKCDNKRIQNFYDNGGYGIIVAYYKQDAEKMLKEITRYFEKRGLPWLK